jgi:hypothetical protein
MRAAKEPAKRKPAVKVATEETPNRGGRPPLPPGVKLIQRSIRLSAANWAKIDENGGLEWLREVIDAQ